MSNLHLELEFNTSELYSSVAQIYVKFSSRKEGSSRSYISPDCISPSELDEAVRHLHSELDKIQERANMKFAAARRKVAKN